MRRDKNDREWQKVKEIVKLRDRGDRILRVLTVKEALLLQRKAPHPYLLRQVDPAHIFPVSIYPDQVYNKNNIVMLNRWSHENLDNMKHPVTGEKISYEERQEWWKKIAGGHQWVKLMHTLGDKDVEESS